MPANTEALLEKLDTILGPGGLITGADLDGRDPGWNKLQTQPLAVMRPRSTEEISTVLALCNEAGQAVVTQGGKTGMADGSATREHEIALSLERMSGIESIDPVVPDQRVGHGDDLAAV